MNTDPLQLNPYHGANFGEFLVIWLTRLFTFLTGQLPAHQLASDDIQILILAGVAASSALVGTFLVLRRMSMLANSLSHTILMGIVLAYFMTLSGHNHEESQSTFIAPMQAMLIGSLIMGFVTAFLTELLTKKGRLQEDASTGIVFTTLFALGIILVTVLTRDAHIGIEAVMGNVDALSFDDLFWVYIILFVNALIFTFFFKEFQLTTFDAGLAQSLGFSPTFFNYLLMAQVSATAIVAFRAVGVLLVLAFMTGPVLTARLLTHDLKRLLYVSVLIGLLSSIIGVAWTRHLLTVNGTALATSGVVVCVIIVFYILAILFAPEQGLFAKWRHRRRLVDKRNKDE